MDTIHATATRGAPPVTRALAYLLAQDPDLDERLIDLTADGAITVEVATIPQYTLWTLALHRAADGHADNRYASRRGRLEAHNTVLGVGVDVVRPLAVTA